MSSLISEEEFQLKEKEITDAVIKVIAIAKKENQEVIDEDVKTMVVDACKLAVSNTLTFQNTMKGCRRPYITHAKQLEVCMKAIDVSLLNVQDVIVTAKGDAKGDGEAAENNANVKELHECRLAASDTIAAFRRWLYTSDASYMFASDRTLEAPEPESPDQAKTDLLRCPRWVLHHLVEARRAQIDAEVKWQTVHKEVNQMKLKIAQLQGFSAAKEEIRKKDELIKKLNNGLRMLYQDMGKKTAQIKEQEEELKKRAEQIKTLAKAKNADVKNNKPGGSPVDSVEDKKKDDEIKKLKEEVGKLKEMLKKEGVGLGDDTLSPRADASTIASALAKQKKAEATFDEKDITPYSEAQYWLPELHKRIALSTVILQPDLAFVDMLGKAIPAGKEAEDMSAYLVKLFIKQANVLEVLEHLIKNEVAKTKSINTLFRGEELSSRVLRVYTRKKGMKYASKVLDDLVKYVSDNNLNYEIDPNRANPSMNLKQNMASLEELTQKFLDKIVNSFDIVPPEFVRLCSTICTEATKRFENVENLAVAGFIFLRFLCPAIAAPESFKLYPVATPEARRTLLLVGKILQNLANGVEFKEDYLTEMNKFLTKNELPCNEFFRKMRTFPPTVNGNAEYLIDISRSLVLRKDKVKAQLEPFQLHNSKWTFSVTTRLDERIKVMLHAVINDNVKTAADLESTPDKAQAFASLLMDNEDCLPQLCVLSIVEQEPEKRRVADSLVTIFQASSQVEFLARTVIQTEVSQSFTAYGFLHSSFSRAVFSAYTAKYCSSWFKSVIGEVLVPIVNQNMALEIEEARLDDAAKKSFNKEESLGKLGKLSNVFLETIANSLASCPRSLWVFANVLATATAQDPFQFIFINFFALAVETPEKYNIVAEKPKREASRTLQLISDVIRDFANAQADKDEVTKYQNIVSQWANNVPPYLSDSQQSGVTMQAISAAVFDLAKWMQSRGETALTPLVQQYSTTHVIRFGVDELLGSFAQPPPKQPKVAAAPSPAGTPVLGAKGDKGKDKKLDKAKEKEEKQKKKEAEKAAKEAEKAAKEAEKAKKKEEERLAKEAKKDTSKKT